MKTFKEWIEEAKDYQQQADGKSYPVHSIRRPEDVFRASKGDNYETHNFSAMRHNAKLDADHAKATGDVKKISDNKKMQHAGEIHLPNLFNPSHPDHKIEKKWFDEMRPEAQKHVLKQHKDKEMAAWKDRNGAS